MKTKKIPFATSEPCQKVRRWGIILWTTCALLLLLWNIRNIQRLQTNYYNDDDYLNAFNLPPLQHPVSALRNKTVEILKKENVDRSMENTTIPSNWIEPRPTNDSLVVLVLSARSNFAQRQAIRETWAHDNVYFVVGTKCDIPFGQREDLACRAMNATSESLKQQRPPRQTRRKRAHLKGDNHDLDEALVKEQSEYNDLLLVAVKESYRSLPLKLIGGISWIVNHTEAQWIAKADDDMVMRMPSLRDYVSSFNHSEHTIMGDIATNATVLRHHSRWAERYYPESTYPLWPRGSRGYVFSRAIAEYLSTASDILFRYYQGEDTSMGIWLDEAPFNATWVQSKMFAFQGNCVRDNYYIMGHNLTPKRIRRCFQWAPIRKRGTMVWKGEKSSPSLEEKQQNYIMLQ